VLADSVAQIGTNHLLFNIRKERRFLRHFKQILALAQIHNSEKWPPVNTFAKAHALPRGQYARPLTQARKERLGAALKYLAVPYADVRSLSYEPCSQGTKRRNVGTTAGPMRSPSEIGMLLQAWLAP
jgi:hypothetical protein